MIDLSTKQMNIQYMYLYTLDLVLPGPTVALHTHNSKQGPEWTTPQTDGEWYLKQWKTKLLTELIKPKLT